MKKTVYGELLEDFDVYTENPSDPCFQADFVPPEYYDSLKKGSDNE